MSALDLRPSPGAAPASQMVRSQAVLELRTTLRNGEQLLLTFVIPLLLLVGLVWLPLLDLGGGSRVDTITPGILTVAVMSTAFTSLAITTGFDRRSGALKLLGSTPLPRWGLLAAKFVAVVVTEAIQCSLITVVALTLGWHPSGSALAALCLVLLGTAAFCSLGLALAGSLRAEATLAVANGVFVLLLLAGGVIVPASSLPEGLGALVSLLPSGALAEGLRSVLVAGAAVPWQAVAVLLAWTAVGAVVCTRSFKWE